MAHRLHCKIVQDLLPNYIEGLTSDVTNTSIEEHLSSCDACKKVLMIMTKEVNEMNKERKRAFI